MIATKVGFVVQEYFRSHGKKTIHTLASLGREAVLLFGGKLPNISFPITSLGINLYG